MNHNAVGWGLFVVSPGLLAGVVLTLIFLRIPVPTSLSIMLWGIAAVASAAGGFLIPKSKAWTPRILTSVAGFLFGASIYFFAMVIADLTTNRF